MMVDCWLLIVISRMTWRAAPVRGCRSPDLKRSAQIVPCVPVAQAPILQSIFAVRKLSQTFEGFFAPRGRMAAPARGRRESRPTQPARVGLAACRRASRRAMALHSDQWAEDTPKAATRLDSEPVCPLTGARCLRPSRRGKASAEQWLDAVPEDQANGPAGDQRQHQPAEANRQGRPLRGVQPPATDAPPQRRPGPDCQP